MDGFIIAPVDRADNVFESIDFSKLEHRRRSLKFDGNLTQIIYLVNVHM